ncbi:MAG: hypothetical protein ACO1OB_27605 [Archangium sp.]
MTCLVVSACGASTPPVGEPDSGQNGGGGGTNLELDAGNMEDAGTSIDAGTRADAGTECATLPFATACTDSATTAPPAGTPGTMGPHGVTVETLTNPRPTNAGDITVYRPTGLTNVPVIFFSHAFGATNPDSYRDLFDVLASNGFAVIHVPYPLRQPGNTPVDERYQVLWTGFLTARTHYATTFDMTRVGFAGHSFGGGATPEMARRGFVEQGWGSNGRFIFVMAPWYSWGTGYDTLPSNTRAVIQVYADDDTNDPAIALEDIWNKLPASLEKSWQTIRTDVCTCGINATHTLPMTRNTFLPNPQNVLNAADRWGTFRRLDALARYTFTQDQTARVVAMGTIGAMGNWIDCGGRAVRPLEATTSPQLSVCASYMYPYSGRCAEADVGVTCP